MTADEPSGLASSLKLLSGKGSDPGPEPDSSDGSEPAGEDFEAAKVDVGTRAMQALKSGDGSAFSSALADFVDLMLSK